MPIAVNAQGDALMLTPQGDWQPTQTAQNPQTGERMAFDGQQWQPLQAGADPSWEAKDLGVAAMRGVPVLGGMYEQSLSPAEQKRAQNFDVAHPYMSTAAKLVGGGVGTTAALAALPEESLAAAVLGGTYGATPLARVLSSAGGGATLGAADAATRGENPLTGAALGGTLGAAAPVVARSLEGVIGPARTALSPVNRTPQVEMPVGNAKVHIYGPEAGAGDVEGQRFLDQARQNRLGDAAKAQVDAADAARNAQLEAAQEQIRQAAAGGAPAPAVSPIDAMAQTQQAVQARAAAARAAAKQEYGAFDQMQGSINTQPAFGGISNALENQLSNLPQPLFAGPRAKAALDELEQNLTARPGMSIQEVSRAMQVFRARKDALSPLTDGYDRTVLGNAANMANQHLQNVLSGPHYAGDPAAFSTLRNADALYANYKQLYGPTAPGDTGGQFVQQMIKDGLSYQQMADRLYGASPKTAGELARNRDAAIRLKSILGDTSPEWRTVQQGYLSHILDDIKTAANAQKGATILDNVFKGGRQFADVMLPAQATQMLDQLRAIYKQLTPLRGAINTSGTAYHLGSMASWLTNGLLAMAGHHVAGPMGMMAGVAGHQLGPKLTSSYRGRAVARQLYGSGAAPMHAPNASASTLEKVLTRASRASSFGR